MKCWMCQLREVVRWRDGRVGKHGVLMLRRGDSRRVRAIGAANERSQESVRDAPVFPAWDAERARDRGRTHGLVPLLFNITVALNAFNTSPAPRSLVNSSGRTLEKS